MEAVGYYKALIFAESDWMVQIWIALLIYHALLSDHTAFDGILLQWISQVLIHCPVWPSLAFWSHIPKEPSEPYPGWHHTSFTFQSSSLTFFCFHFLHIFALQDCRDPSLPSQTGFSSFPNKTMLDMMPSPYTLFMQFIHQNSDFLFIHMQIFWFLLYSVHIHLFFTLVIIECRQ